MSIVKWIFGIIATLVALYFIAALSLIFWPEPDYYAQHPITAAEYQTGQEFGGVNYSANIPFSEVLFTARDGANIFARQYEPTALLAQAASIAGPNQPQTPGTVIIYLHGIGSTSALLNHSAGLLVSATHATIITPDLRGHGASDGRRFDVDHIGQYEEDIADIALILRTENPKVRILIAGHSMGGGIALRYALLDDAPKVNGYLLFAPNFGQGPTQSAQTDVDPATAEFIKAFFNFNTKRFIGTIMMNVVGIRVFDHNPVLYLNAPPAMPAYSYAAIASAQPNAPQDTTVALTAIGSPLIVVVGENDEAFIATAYEGIVSAHSDGETIILPELNHNQVINSAATFDVVSRWYADIP